MFAIQWSRFLPYHVARLDVTRRLFKQNHIEVIGVETAWHDPVYTSFRRIVHDSEGIVSAFPSDLPGMNPIEIARHISELLDQLKPSVVAINGYGFPDSLACLQWCLRTRTPALVMSDSWERDFHRRRWREWLKSLIVRQFDAAFVAGTRHAEYMKGLGINSESISTGYDVVDNAFFMDGASKVREDGVAFASKLKLPSSYFLASGRFVARKNFETLVQAYQIYRQHSEGDYWGLVIAGEGPLRESLRTETVRLGVADSVHFPGFVDYTDLPKLYGLARAYICPSISDQWALVVNEAMASGLPVLVSTGCGCASDLVTNGVNGYTFDPFDIQSLSDEMQRITNSDTEAMGLESQRIVQHFSLQSFAESLLSAYLKVEGTKRGTWNATWGSSLIELCLRVPVRYETFS